MREPAEQYRKITTVKGQNDVCWTAAPVRCTHGTRGYSYVILLDHTGHIAIWGKTDIEEKICIGPFPVSSDGTVLIECDSSVHYVRKTLFFLQVTYFMLSIANRGSISHFL